MNAVLKIFLSMSVSGGLLILALLLGKRLLKDKISRQWQYYIWLAVILRLLLPFGPEANLLGKTYQAVDRAITQAAPFPQQQPTPNAPGDVSPSADSLDPNNENLNHPAKNLNSAHPLQDIGTLLTDHIWVIWLAAALGLLIRKVTIYQGFMRYIKAGLTPVSDLAILDRLSSAGESAGVKKPIELCVNPLISSPLLIGFFHPCIVLPGADISEKDFQYIVLHELTHYKRRDMFYKWLVQLTVCLHWFNPLVHLMSREITRACEFSCDEAVLAKMGSGSAQDYGKTLLDAMAAVGRYRESLGAVTLSENKKLLKERLGAIMKFKKVSTAVKLLTAVLTLCIVLGASFVGIYTTGNAQEASLPDTLPDTADRPSLSLDVSSAAVNVLAAADNKISAEYNSNVYTVDINEKGSEWNVSISCKTRRNTNDETINLYIPDVDYDNVYLSADSGHLICGLIRSGNIVGSFNMASAFLTLPEGFTGSVNVAANSGYFQLVSQDNFKNTTTTITDNGRWGVIYTPKGFQENGNNYTFTDGTEANVIQVTREGSGVMGIYTSDALDALNFPEEWMDWRQDEWQGKPWEEDWGQNTWPEDDFEAGSNPVSPSQIEQHYESGNLLMFQIEFSRLNEDAQIEWLNRIYTDGNIAYMNAAVTLLDEDCTAILNLAEAIYTDGNIAFFSSLAMHMSEDTLETWLERALADENWVFQSVLFNALDKSDEFKEIQEKREKKWAEAQTAEYQAAGVTVDGKNYYYQGQLVNIFLDIRSNKSFYTLNVNPAGTINIKIVRNENNEITGVDYMTETEVTELFGDMDEPDDIDVENPG